MIKTIIFDFFGVISSPALLDWIQTNNLEEVKTDILVLADQLDSGAITLAEFNEYVGHRTGLAPEVVKSGIEGSVVIDPEMITTITDLGSHYKIGLLSNVNEEFLENVFSREGLHAHFNVIIASSSYNQLKKDKDLFHIILDKLGCKPEETVFIDDSASNVEVAQELGLAGILFESTGQMKESLNVLGVKTESQPENEPNYELRRPM